MPKREFRRVRRATPKIGQEELKGSQRSAKKRGLAQNNVPK
ncbi:hypothetical protein DAD186_11240 [Dermabacter vaginalis]|uniref:Uncharacterized protein n=1 Tax=Dermabacter vaginalis TaxID=1630135 RepID=A0A1B0ZI81_9MICO|nr:hypothetical protein DAD186_11240 [Dermabacter vaginalis]